MWLWCFDRAGAVVSSRFNFIRHLPLLVLVLAILQHFNEEDWGMHPAFVPCYDGKDSFLVNLQRPLSAGGTQTVAVKIDTSSVHSRLSLFSRATIVCPATSDVLKCEGDMITKIYHSEETRTSEVEILARAYEVAALADKEGMDGARVRGRLPTLLA